MVPMVFLRKRHPINLLLLALFTVCMSFAVGVKLPLRERRHYNRGGVVDVPGSLEPDALHVLGDLHPRALRSRSGQLSLTRSS
jgi:hypothetical protein